jgi:hypothetical protein
MSDVNTGIPAARSFHIDFTLATANTYNLALSPIGGGNPLFTQVGAPLTGTAGSGINRLRLSAYGTGSSATGSKEVFFDNLAVARPGALGDYNQDGAVNSADYVIWRKTLGQTGTGLAADGNRNNQIDAGDYSVWRANFGSSATGAGSIAQVVPEPSSWLIFITGFALLCRGFNAAVGCRR